MELQYWGNSRINIDMMNMEHDEIYSSMLVNKSIVYEYFRLIKYKDIHGLLSLFADDAIVHEPFSNIPEGLQGKAAIEPFLEIAMMASNGLTPKIKFWMFY
jgi:ketosteroid isomerase-like protein